MALSLFSARFQVLWVLLGEMLYVYYVVMRFRKGVPRLLALLPVLPSSFIVPWRAQTPGERALYSFVFLWTIMSKQLLLVWDMGPAADSHVISSFPRFFSAMAFSLHLKRDRRFTSNAHLTRAAKDVNRSVAGDDDAEGSSKRNGYNSENSELPNGLGLGRRKAIGGAKPGPGKAKKSESEGVEVQELLLQNQVDKQEAHFLCPRWVENLLYSQYGPLVVVRSIITFLAAASLVRTVQEWRHVMPIYVLDLFLGFILYFSSVFLFESTAGVSACLLGTQLHPQFNMPFLADSLADFWGRRWNLLVNNLLRVSVYEPTLAYLGRQEEADEQKRKKAGPRDRAIATGVTFLVSGLMHELIFFYVNKTRPTGEMTAFFVLHGAAVVLEGLLKPRDRLGMPRLLRWAYTMIFVYITASWLFFAPVFRTGMVDQCLNDLQMFTDWIGSMIVGGLLERKLWHHPLGQALSRNDVWKE